jgi:hypothetical protein
MEFVRLKHGEELIGIEVKAGSSSSAKRYRAFQAPVSKVAGRGNQREGILREC